MGGSYSSLVQKGTLSSTAGKNYYVKLRKYYNYWHIPVLLYFHNLQIRVYMDQLANVIALSGGTGAPAATIT